MGSSQSGHFRSILPVTPICRVAQHDAAATTVAHCALLSAENLYGARLPHDLSDASTLIQRKIHMSRRTRHGARNGQGRTHVAEIRSGSGLIQFARKRPLLVVGLGIGLGMALGALLPWSRMEDELLGDQAERLKDTVRDLASDGYEKVRSVAQKTYESAADTIQGTEKSVSGNGATLGTDTNVPTSDAV